MKTNTDSLISEAEVASALKVQNRLGVLVAKGVMRFLKLNKINSLYSNYSHLKGVVFLNRIIDATGIKYKLNPQWQMRIPIEGPFIVIANHPYGAIEGTVLLRNLAVIRPDIKIMSNYLLSRIEPVSDFVVSVNPLATNQSSFSGIKNALTHINNGGALIIFPAGQISGWQEAEKKITDRTWDEGMIRFIKRAEVPVIPIYFDGGNSKLFYFVSYLHPLLRLAWIPREFFNKKNKLFNIHVGHPIDIEEQQIVSGDINKYGHFLRDSLYILERFIPDKNQEHIKNLRFDYFDKLKHSVAYVSILWTNLSSKIAFRSIF